MSPKKRPTKKTKKLASVKGNNANLLSIVGALALGILIGYFIWGNVEPEVIVVDNAGESITPRDPLLTEPPSEGPDDAPIEIVEFSDFQCPYCTKWHNETYKPLLELYPDQIKLVYRNFPLTSIHADAYLAAEAAMCAAEQERYWDYHEALFESRYGMGRDALKDYAVELGLDTKLFNECLDGHIYQDFVREDMEYAASLGVQSTPTFFVNGELVVGAQPLEVFVEIIEGELAKLD